MVRAELTLARVLIVPGDAESATGLRMLLGRHGFVTVEEVPSPRDALTAFQALRPDLVLLDLELPGADGIAVLRALREAVPEASYLPILVLASGPAAALRTGALRAGATDYVGKPFDSDELLLRITNLLDTRFLHLQLQDQARWLEQHVAERTRALEEVHLEVCDRLARAAEFRDDATGQHTRRVGRTAAVLADTAGLDRATTDLIGHAAPLHDVGKIAIPDEILLKPGELTPAEFEVIKTHTTAGAELLSGGHSRLMQMAEQIARSHHERWDGSGYPYGVAGEAIPLPARVVAVADFFDALTHPRPYRGAWSCGRVVDTIRQGAGRQFDPMLVEAFLELPHAELV